jgi:hypothetical protein
MHRRPILELLREREERFLAATQRVDLGYRHNGVAWGTGVKEYFIQAKLLGETFIKAGNRFPDDPDVKRICNGSLGLLLALSDGYTIC